jgi:hypothetical protein
MGSHDDGLNFFRGLASVFLIYGIGAAIAWILFTLSLTLTS